MGGVTAKDRFQQKLPFGETPASAEEAISAIQAKVQECILLANHKYKVLFPSPTLDYSLTGACAGQHIPQKFTTRTIPPKLRFNIPLALDNWDDYLATTVPHEVAHLVVSFRWQSRAKPHGPQWKKVMQECFGIEPKRCHSYDVSKHAKRVARPFLYSCDCQEFKLTRTMHQRIRRGAGRQCRSCKGVLVFVREVENQDGDK